MRSLAIILWSVLALAYPASLLAHQGGTTGYAAISIEGQMVRYTLTLSARPASAPAASPAFRTPDESWLAALIAERVRLTSDGARCEAGPGYGVPPGEGVVSVSAHVDFVCPGTVGDLLIRDDLFDVLGGDLHTLARIRWAGGTEQVAFSTEMREAQATTTSCSC